MVKGAPIPLPLLIAGAFALGFGGYSLAPTVAATLSTHAPDCNIKGNISKVTGEHIYHMPGQRYYDATVITPSTGERWFCSEDEARAAGWRRSKL